MTETRAQDVGPMNRGTGARGAEQRIVDPATGPITLAADTFGHILPELQATPARRRLRPVTTLVVVAVTLASVGLIVSWFGPWGAGFGVIGALIGLIAQLRQRARTSWCVSSYVIGGVTVLFSSYWVWWILDELSTFTPPA
ncbi:hypothetical protein GCM10010922_10190 [Microbacterium sorbitolivorans]|uniref:Uncharacterized protein n=1 Tax=Microbacterium sorbitolivorans TaxID=1867410 RepID=A0A367XYL4_9MICO|nr:hypothetical protein [Microbacterium sorbitolivorans]RCK58489.1 hypothetical protein DTO57_10010 [Microbacterium sorbitolivorans]GGF36940.1 hypothetical protein GCM10010922_10190 [Microbacterium sorbitolivorans]